MEFKVLRSEPQDSRDFAVNLVDLNSPNELKSSLVPPQNPNSHFSSNGELNNNDVFTVIDLDEKPESLEKKYPKLPVESAETTVIVDHEADLNNSGISTKNTNASTVKTLHRMQSNTSEPQNIVLFDSQEPTVEEKIENLTRSAKREKLDVNPYSVIALYCSIDVLLSLSQTSRQIREVVTADSLWMPYVSPLIAENVKDETMLVTPANVLQAGFCGSAFQTWLRAHRLLKPIIDQPENLESEEFEGGPLNAIDLAYTLSNALSLAENLELESNKLQNLRNAVLDAQNKLIDSLAIAVSDDQSVEKLLQACNVWCKFSNNETFQQRVLEVLFSESLPSLEADSVFSFNGENNERTASQRKISAAFGKVTSFLINMIPKINDIFSPLPSEWKRSAWHYVLSKALANIVVFVQAVLLEATEISELEYLQTVVKIFNESKILRNNSVLIEHADSEINVQLYLESSMMKPLLDEFCERQIEYVEAFNKSKVEDWITAVNQHEFETEEFLWSSVPKKSDKTNFMSSFKWAFSAVSDASSQSKTKSTVNEAGSIPETEFEAQTAVLVAKLKGMENLVSFELALETLNTCKDAIKRLKTVERENAKTVEPIFCSFIRTVGQNHIKSAFEKAIKVLNSYDPKKFGRLLVPIKNGQDPQNDNESNSEGKYAVEPLAVFAQLVNVGDLVQQMVQVFFDEELVATRLIKQSNFGAPSVNEKRQFELMLDSYLAEGLSRGIDVLMDQVEFVFNTEQLGSDYLPVPTQEITYGQTQACTKVINLVKSHLDLLRDSAEKGLFDVFQQEVGIRLFHALSKHLKKQTISIDGAINLISDTNAFYNFILTLKQRNLLPYYEALKQIAQLFLIDKRDAKQIGIALSDSSRYNNVMSIEELIEFIKRRQDWPLIKHKVEKVLYGLFNCIIM